MTEKEMIQKNIEEFSRLQDYMLADGEDGKAILQAFGINLTDIDRIKA